MTLMLVMNLGFAWGASTAPAAAPFWCATTGSSAMTGGGDLEELE
jgi:hypothetical protein